MANLLYLVHRLPYPPNKGDKVRSYHLLRHLAAGHRVFLGTFIDDPDDAVHVDTLRPLCADLCALRLDPRWAKVRSLNALLSDEALTQRYYRDARLFSWVERIVRNNQIDAAVIFSSAMAQYVEDIPRLPLLVDFVDVDSAKWTQYAPQHRWPMSWIYRREGKRLLAYERQLAARADRSFFVTENESQLFRSMAPECAIRIETMENGVDSNYFAPDRSRPSPFADGEIPLVFTGAMDYWPNIDAVVWFVETVLPALLEKFPRLKFHIVGRSPAPAVQLLAGERIAVTGTVPDVRPYLQHAAAVVAPLRVARGIQNKILEAMAMARPVVAAESCVAAIDASPGSDLLAASEPEDYRQALEALLADPERARQIGDAGRQRVVARYSWEAHMAGIDRYLATRHFNGAPA